jgi:hypothetical protein
MGRDSHAWLDDGSSCNHGCLLSPCGVLELCADLAGGSARQRHGKVLTHRRRARGELRTTRLPGDFGRGPGAVDERLGDYNRCQRSWSSSRRQPGISWRDDHDSHAVYRSGGAEADTGGSVAARCWRGSRSSGVDRHPGGSRRYKLQETCWTPSAGGLDGRLLACCGE